MRVQHIPAPGEKAEMVDVMCMRKAEGRRLAEVLAELWRSEPKEATYAFLSEFGRFLKAFHVRYDGREHGRQGNIGNSNFGGHF